MQKDYNTHIIRLQNEVNRVFGKVVTSVADFEQLAEKVHLSPQSLRRFYGKILECLTGRVSAKGLLYRTLTPIVLSTLSTIQWLFPTPASSMHGSEIPTRPMPRLFSKISLTPIPSLSAIALTQRLPNRYTLGFPTTTVWHRAIMST